MSNQPKIHSRVSSFFNLIITIFVIIIGLSIIQLSVLGGLGLIVAGLLISKKIKTIISNKFPNISSKTLKFFNMLPLILICVSLPYTMFVWGSQMERRSFIEEKVSILKKINDEIDSNKLSHASISIKRFESAAADDADFKVIKEKYLAAQKADDERKKKEAEEEKQQQAEAEKVQAEVRNLPNGELIFYKDGGSTSNNISIAQYEYACKQIKQSASITNQSIRIQGVGNNLIFNLLQTNGIGSIKNKFVHWSSEEQACTGLFDIVGTYNGTTYNKKYGGYIYTFVKDNAGISGNIGGFVRDLSN
jgi:hypothetical protein